MKNENPLLIIDSHVDPNNPIDKSSGLCMVEGAHTIKDIEKQYNYLFIK